MPAQPTSGSNIACLPGESDDLDVLFTGPPEVIVRILRPCGTAYSADELTIFSISAIRAATPAASLWMAAFSKTLLRALISGKP